MEAAEFLQGFWFEQVPRSSPGNGNSTATVLSEGVMLMLISWECPKESVGAVTLPKHSVTDVLPSSKRQDTPARDRDLLSKKMLGILLGYRSSGNKQGVTVSRIPPVFIGRLAGFEPGASGYEIGPNKLISLI
jgi:hypothetical protein